MRSIWTAAERIEWLLALALFLLFLAALYSAPARASDIYSAALPALGVAERTVDGINTPRGTDMLIVYTPGTGRATTGTNQWGYEVVVEDGYVVAAGGNNSPIPQNGFVVSAHGASIPWLQENAPVGARVTLNGRELRITGDAESHKRLAADVLRYTEEVLGTAWDMVPRASQDEVAHSMDRAQAALMDGEYGKAIQLAGEARFYGTPSLPVELRGIWHRPVERSPIAVRHTLDQLAAAGFNALFLETFYTGYTIYPSAIAPQRGEFVGWDPLQVWAEEAAARGIELHLWVHLFHLGRITVDMHPDWANLQRDGSIGAALEPGLYYGDPGHPEVREYVFSVLREMVERYPVTGLHLDYVRYPNTNSLANTSGYSPKARELFKEVSGYDPMDISPSTHPTVWAEWLKWQEQNITSFVERVAAWRDEHHPDLILSAAVVPDIDEAIRTKRQNWLAWTEAGWLDLVTPMIYSLDNGHVAGQIAALSGKTGSAWFVPGLAPFMGMSPHQVIDQVMSSRAAGQPGAVLFALHSVDARHMDAYAKGLFSMKAGTPWNVRGALASFAAWIIEGMNRWVAEDILPADTALELDNFAHDVARWLEQGPDAPVKGEWLDTLRDAHRALDSPFYETRGQWLRMQIGLMVEVLGRAEGA